MNLELGLLRRIDRSRSSISIRTEWKKSAKNLILISTKQALNIINMLLMSSQKISGLLFYKIVWDNFAKFLKKKKKRFFYFKHDFICPTIATNNGIVLCALTKPLMLNLEWYNILEAIIPGLITGRTKSSLVVTCPHCMYGLRT